jgi:hypothetical protein
MKRLFVALLAAFTASSVLAGEKERQNSVKNLALLMIAEARCPNLRPNYTAMGHGMSVLGVSPKDWGDGGRYHNLLVSEIERQKAEVIGMTQESFCSFMEDGFGTDGVIASGMIKHR